MATNYVTLVNKVLVRMNEVLLDVAGDGFDAVRNVQALAKDAVNNSIRLILQDGQEWPFLKQTYTQALTAGTRQYSFPADMSTVDWDTFYLNPALEMLKTFLDTKDHGGYVKILPGNHGDFMTEELVRSLYQEMADQFEAGKIKK